MRFLYQLLNLFFFIFHSFLVIFNLLGWIWRKTRLINLIIIILTLGSWFILGFWYGYGYCPFTDWHWQVREKLGNFDHPPSYTAFLIREITGWEPPDKIINSLTLGLLLLAFLASISANIRDFIIKKKNFPLSSKN
ncbi:MAG: DUF2784 domain-containing protein [Candidatus Aminicenantes bacterium]|nr:DUF2784 domain-containing protein [Candidatus Aminicenantes bacterium]